MNPEKGFFTDKIPVHTDRDRTIKESCETKKRNKEMMFITTYYLVVTGNLSCTKIVRYSREYTVN